MATAETVVSSIAVVGTEALFRAHARFVASFVYRLVARGVQVDDLAQEVFLLAHARGGYRPGAARPTTLLALLAFEAMHIMRRRDQRLTLAHSEPLAAHAVGGALEIPGEALLMQRFARDPHHALNAIEHDRRAVFVQFELQGESCDAIAAAFEIKTGTGYSRLHAARAELRARARGPAAREEER